MLPCSAQVLSAGRQKLNNPAHTSLHTLGRPLKMRPIFILTKKVVENLLNDFFRYNLCHRYQPTRIIMEQPHEKLTAKEEETMLLLWKYGPCSVKQLLCHFDEPRPPYQHALFFRQNARKERFRKPSARIIRRIQLLCGQASRRIPQRRCRSLCQKIFRQLLLDGVAAHRG